MIDAVMKKYRKKGAQPVQEFRSEMYAKQRDDETCVDVWQRIKGMHKDFAMHVELLRRWI
jgi:hypothetical protein